MVVVLVIVVVSGSDVSGSGVIGSGSDVSGSGC